MHHFLEQVEAAATQVEHTCVCSMGVMATEQKNKPHHRVVS